jgi:hypothetical protein
MHTFPLWGDRKERDHLEERVFGEFNIEMELTVEG